MQTIIDIEKIKEIAIQAGKIIMSSYKTELNITIKFDESPVTHADLAANEYINEKLSKLTPNIPIIAEENIDNHQKIISDEFWLVDPLDGTKGFIARNGQFTVNIGLIKNGKPTIGVIYLPVTDTIYFTDGKLAFKQQEKNSTECINVTKKHENLTLVSSYVELNSRTSKFITQVNPTKLITMSSSIKFCLLAEGMADIYPSFGRTMEWDTAAGHAILLAAGGKVEDLNGSCLSYNKLNFENGGFIAYGKS
jgi:3'(2'), 5'-bisphosphate nucleotidase